MNIPLEPIDNTFSRRLEARGFQVQRGFTDAVAQALHEGANDPVITKYTHDGNKFQTPELVRRWHENPLREHVVYSLADRAVSGVVWFATAPSQFSDASQNFNIRIYEGARDRSLAADFLEAAHEDFTETQGGDDTWALVHRQNALAKNLLLRHHYQIGHQSKSHMTMTRIADPERRYNPLKKVI